MGVVDRESAVITPASFGRTLRQFRDPVLLFAVPVSFALLLAFVGYRSSWPVGFDFRGTLWEPARALLDGNAIYPEPTRDAVVVGNPAVYPPLFILVAVPLALLPVAAAAWLWLVILAVAVVAAMWVVGVRDWRCHVLAVTSPVVVHGVYFGNLTVFLLLPLALAWKYRDTARIVGVALGVAMAAKLFVAPVLVWLLLTRRFAAAAWATGSAVVLVLGAWALVGFDGLRDYPKLLRVLQDVYAVRSISVSTVASVLGASESGRDLRGRPRGSRMRGRCGLGRPPGRRRPTCLRNPRRGMHPRVSDRLAELHRSPLRADRGDLAEDRTDLVLRVRNLAPRRGRTAPERVRRLLQAGRRAAAGMGLEPHRASPLVSARGDGDRRVHRDRHRGRRPRAARRPHRPAGDTRVTTESSAERAPYRPTLPSGSLRLAVTRWPSVVVWSTALLWGIGFSMLAARRHNGFLSHRFDLGNMTQAVWSTAHGRFLELTTTDGQQLTRLAVHVDPLLAFFAPLWWVWPSPVMLTTLQALALATGALPVYSLGRKHIGDDRAALNLALAYLLYPAVQWASLNDFHPVTFAIPLLLFMIWALDQDRLVLAGLFGVLAALSKEDVPLVIAGIGIWYAVSRRKPLVGGAIAALGVGWTLVDLYVVIPHFSGGHSRFYERLESVGGSPSGVLREFVSDPGAIWAAATTGSDLRYLFLLLVPLLGLWALEPLLALAALPVLALNLLSDFWSMNRIEYQYVSTIVACLFAASAIGAGKLGPRRAVFVTTAVLALVLVATLSGPLASLDTFDAKEPVASSRAAAIRRALALVPSEAAVSSSNSIGAHLSERRRLYAFPLRARADWVVLDSADPWLASEGERDAPNAYRRAIETLREATQQWTPVFADDGVLVYRRAGTGADGSARSSG